jgi:heptosyltransferase-2
MNVLLVRAGALGDVLLLRTAVAALRAAGHRVSLLAPSSAGAALVGPGPGEVDRVLAWESAPMASLLAADHDDIAPQARTALSPFAAVIAYTSSAALVEALGATGARVIARAPLPPRGGPHAARWLAEAVTVLGADAAITPPVLVATSEEEERARPWRERLGPAFLALHPGSGSALKNWPPARFGAVVSKLAPGRPWLLAEGPADTEAATPLAGLPMVVPARHLPVRVLGALLAQARLFVGNDSGLSHLAAAFAAPVLALFGPTDPAQWAPVGPRVRVLRSADGTMEGLGTDEVVRAAEEMASGIV